jgi:hypothetical protein
MKISKVTSRAVTTILSGAVVGMLLVPAASACDLSPSPAATFNMVQPMQNAHDPAALVTSASLARELSNAATAKSPSIVGMWSFQLISVGNTTRNPSIPDGAQVNFGYTQYHSDETEILNAGARSPAQQNFCLGAENRKLDLPGHSFFPELRRGNWNVARQNSPR